MAFNPNDLTLRLIGGSFSYARRFLFRVLTVGPIPKHIAFILDGNRRFARKQKLKEGLGHRAGFLSLMSMMKYCSELGVKYVTIYAFSIDNFKRRPEEVQFVMDLMLEKIEGLIKEESIVNQYGVRVCFIGNMKLLNEPVRIAAENAMRATSNNDKSFLLICMAYTSTDEIVHAAEASCEDKWARIQPSLVEISEVENGEAGANADEDDNEDDVIKLRDVERHMYMGLAPDPDILIRTSGETRLSNFLLWQTSNSLLYSPDALWPEFGLRHLLMAIMTFQRLYPYLEKKRKQI